MSRFSINNFGNGLSNDRYDGRPGQAAHSKQFDTLTFPRLLYPLRGMAADTANTGIGNIIVGSNGLLFGSGEDATNPGNGKLWYRTGYGATDGWAALPSNQLSGVAAVKDLLVENPDAGQIRSMYWASTNMIVASDPAGGSSCSTDALTFSSIGQGLLHPKDKIIYFPYRTTTASYIGLIAPNASAFGGKNYTAFALPFTYRAYCLSYYGNYLAIPMTSVTSTGVGSGYNSLVGLWSRDTSVTTLDETIPWGPGNLQVLNNLNGVLVGISTKSANYSGSFQDYDSILIKYWAGGAEPELIQEIKVPYSAGGTPTASHPTATLNPRVNFVYNNRLYFSINLVSGDGIHPARYGLWSVGKNAQGRWTVIQERVATNANSDTGVLAAAMTGDFVSMCHSAEGTLTFTINGTQSSSTYAATSVFESLVNAGMQEEDLPFLKKIYCVGVHTQPLPNGASVVLKYRVDSSGSDTDWQTLIPYSTVGGTYFDTGALNFTDGYDYEWRLESTGGAIPVSLIGRYDLIPGNI